MRPLQKYGYIIWLVGSGVWWVNAALALHAGHRPRALASLGIALVFFACGMFFSRTPPPRPGGGRRQS